MGKTDIAVSARELREVLEEYLPELIQGAVDKALAPITEAMRSKQSSKPFTVNGAAKYMTRSRGYVCRRIKRGDLRLLPDGRLSKEEVFNYCDKKTQQADNLTGLKNFERDAKCKNKK